ncbi:hypothetical protein NPIL_189761 [Nephila pilipes]|uniref:Uncharacterized protein n=1 Tax=Nephila pilipes TaxID=299642 RepID=A0A8X6PM88_NEPPI|nr:hypothetical protein NPIL_189761 [Nephila pilipes]
MIIPSTVDSTMSMRSSIVVGKARKEGEQIDQSKTVTRILLSHPPIQMKENKKKARREKEKRANNCFRLEAEKQTIVKIRKARWGWQQTMRQGR